ncbi:hypothetical protein [Chlorobium ferrooxidans]|nr:hypothetical protein [Chlorobium ferrooxidans]
MNASFNLPGSSYEEVQKIIKGYSHSQDNASLDSLAKLIGLHSTIISSNNKFLSDIGIISGGMKKSATELGKRLGRALDHHHNEDISKYFAEAVQTNETVSGLISTVRIKGGMSEKEFSEHILYVSGQKNNSRNKTGARCVVDVLIASMLLEEKDNKLTVATPLNLSVNNRSQSESELGLLSNDIRQEAKTDPSNIMSNVGMNVPQIAINIQLHLPETDNGEVYEKLFKALREQLISPKN